MSWALASIAESLSNVTFLVELGNVGNTFIIRAENYSLCSSDWVNYSV
jgi:hypothetical protein